MANNILITPASASITFSGSGANTIRLQVEPSGSVAFYGTAGSLFGISDSLSGSLMSVNDISGLPILEVFSDDRVVMGTFGSNTLVVTGSNIGIGTAIPNQKLSINGSANITGSFDVSGSLSTVGTFKVQQALEKNTIYGTGMGSSFNYDILTQAVVFYSGNATNNCALNFRGNSSTTLNSVMSTGQSLTLVLLVTNGASTYYPNAYTIDGNAVTPKWMGGSAPSAGHSNSIDAYTYTIIKTADATFTMFAAQVVFA